MRTAAFVLGTPLLLWLSVLPLMEQVFCMAFACHDGACETRKRIPPPSRQEASLEFERELPLSLGNIPGPSKWTSVALRKKKRVVARPLGQREHAPGRWKKRFILRIECALESSDGFPFNPFPEFPSPSRPGLFSLRMERRAMMRKHSCKRALIICLQPCDLERMRNRQLRLIERLLASGISCVNPDDRTHTLAICPPFVEIASTV